MIIERTETFPDEASAQEAIDKFMRAWPPMGYDSRARLSYLPVERRKAGDLAWRVDFSRCDSCD